MKKNILILTFLILPMVFLSACGRSGPIQGTFKTSENLGEIEFKKDGKVYFKKLGIEGNAVQDKDQVAVKSGIVTYYFTRKSDGTLVEGVSNPSQKILPPPSTEKTPPLKTNTPEPEEDPYNLKMPNPDAPKPD